MLQQIETSISQLFSETENPNLFTEYKEEDWLSLAEKIKDEGKLTFKMDAIASVLYWIYSGKPEYEFPESSQSSATFQFSKENKFSVGRQASFTGNGEKGVKFYHRPWKNLFFDYGTKIWKGGCGEVAILKLLNKNNIPTARIHSFGFINQLDWPFWKNLDSERNPKAVWNAYIEKNNGKMEVRGLETENDVLAIEMEDLGKLSDVSEADEAKKLYEELRNLLLSHGISLTDASVEKTIKQSEKGLVALDFGFAEAVTEEGLKILLSELPDKNARNYCYHWQKNFGLKNNS